jgi:hypothetical protein
MLDMWLCVRWSFAASVKMLAVTLKIVLLCAALTLGFFSPVHGLTFLVGRSRGRST